MSHAFHLPPDVLSRYRALRFNPKAERRHLLEPFPTLYWTDEHPDGAPDLEGDPLWALEELCSIRSTLWTTREIAEEDRGFWLQALEAMPDWPGFQRLALSKDDHIAYLRAQELADGRSSSAVDASIAYLANLEDQFGPNWLWPTNEIAPASFRDEVDRWVLIRDGEGLLTSELRHFGAPGPCAIGFVYIDHEMGISCRVTAFCTADDYGHDIQINGAPSDRGTALIFRHDILRRLEVTRLHPAERQRLRLLRTPNWLRHYRNPAMETVRRYRYLDPLRAPGYPDDIQFIIQDSDGLPPELVWGRLLVDGGAGSFICTLLSQPHQADYAPGDTVLVQVDRTPDRVVAWCVGKPRP